GGSEAAGAGGGGGGGRPPLPPPPRRPPRPGVAGGGKYRRPRTRSGELGGRRPGAPRTARPPPPRSPPGTSPAGPRPRRGAREEDEEAEVASSEAFLRESLGKTLEELTLPARAINALKSADMHLVADLVQKSETDLVDVKNLGEKSIDEIKTALATLGLSLGM